MLARNIVVVFVCVMIAGTVAAESEMGHIRPKSVAATCSVNSAQISWEEVHSANLTGYDVYEKSPGNPDFIKVNQNLIAETFYIVTDLASSTQYHFAVTAVYSDGIASDLSDPAGCVTG